MIKLYKTKPDGLHYWEVWQDGSELVVHWGLVGTMGESKRSKLKLGADVEKVMEREAHPLLEEGYGELEPEYQLVIQVKCDGFGTGSDLDKRYQIEEWMNNALGWTGLGICDGGDIGSGTANVFCFVIDGRMSAHLAVAVLRQEGALDGVTVAFHKLDFDEDGDGGSDYEVVWPEDSTQEFELFESPSIPPKEEHISVDGLRLLNASELKSDMVVFHEQFGRGVVTGVTEHNMVGVSFKNSGTRVLASDYAKLYSEEK